METKKVKYGMLTTLSIVVAVLMVSSVSAVPYTHAQKTDTDEQIQQILEKIMNSRRFQTIKKLVEPHFNETTIEHMRTDITANLLTTSNLTLDGDPYMPLLVQILIAIMETTVLLLGHNSVSIAIGGLLICMVALIPSILFAIPISFGYSLEYWSLINPDIDAYIYQFGVIGGIIVFICLIPVILLLMLLTFLPLYAIMFIDVYFSTLQEVPIPTP